MNLRRVLGRVDGLHQRGLKRLATRLRAGMGVELGVKVERDRVRRHTRRVGALQTASLMVAQRRSVVAVGANTSHSVLWHERTRWHSRSLTSDGATSSYFV